MTKIVTIGDGPVSERAFHSRSDYLAAMHRLGEQYLAPVHQSRRLTTDMDGVLIHDDNAITAARIVAGPEAQTMFGTYARLNIAAVAEGKTAYCWYAPTVFVGQLLKGLSSEINRVVGRNMRLIPGARELMTILMKGLNYQVTALTAGHQEAAEEVSRRLSIQETVGTQLGVSEDLIYDGTVKRFVGGTHKLDFVRRLLSYQDGSHKGTHIGDSWSDVETLADVSNSLAFNPGCSLALKNAKISVIGTSLVGLLPFLDPERRYDSTLDEHCLPEVVVVMESDNPQGGDVDTVLEEILPRSLYIKKNVLEERVRQESLLDRTIDEVEARIRSELRRRGIDFQTRVESFMSTELFDAHAKGAYGRLERLAV